MHNCYCKESLESDEEISDSLWNWGDLSLAETVTSKLKN